MRSTSIRYFMLAFLITTNVVRVKAQQLTDTVFTLQQCLDIAIKNNLQVKQSETQMEASRIYWQQARENLLPAINGNVSHNLSDGRSLNPFTNGYLNQQITSANYGLSGSLILSSGLTLQNNIKQTALAFRAGQMDFEQAKNNLTLNIIIAYLQVLSSEDQLTQATTQAKISEEQEKRIEILDKQGAAPPSQLFDLKGQSAGDRLALVNGKNSLAIAKLNILQLMNVTYQPDTKFERQPADALPVTYLETANEVFNQALNSFAMVKAGSLRRESAEKGLKAAKGALLPSLSLYGGWNTNYSSAAQRSVFSDSSVVSTNQFVQGAAGRQTVFATRQNYNDQKISYGDQFKNNYGTSVSVGINIPILNYVQNRNRITLSKLNLQEAKYTEQSNQVQLKVNIDQAYVNMKSGYDRYQLLSDQVNAFTASFRISEIRFNAGAITSVEFLIVKSNLDRAKIDLINARYDYLIRTKILDYYQGKLEL